MDVKDVNTETKFIRIYYNAIWGKFLALTESVFIISSSDCTQL